MRPRAGFVYDFYGDGSIVLRGGYGIYYSQVVDNSVASYALGETNRRLHLHGNARPGGFPVEHCCGATCPRFPPAPLRPSAASM